MKQFREPSPEQLSDPMMEIHAILGRIQVEGAMDEEGPFIAGLLGKIERNELSPTEALKHIHTKMASRNTYH